MAVFMLDFLFLHKRIADKFRDFIKDDQVSEPIAGQNDHDVRHPVKFTKHGGLLFSFFPNANDQICLPDIRSSRCPISSYIFL